ncbi:MAG: LysM peptidoglycan-binding domain-containing protein, partial [Anaerolineae bacterium]
MLLLLAGMVALTAFLWLRSAVPISEGLEQGSGQWFLPAVQAPSLSASPTAVFTESLNPTPVPSPTTIVIDPVGSPAGREPTPLPIKTTIPVTPTAVLITPTSSLCSLPIDWQTYTIQRGDTLYSLARQRGTNATAVK